MPALPPKPVAAFHVATSSSPRSRQQDDEDLAAHEASALARAFSIAGPSALALKLDWVEKLSEPNTPLAILKQAAKHLDPPTYDDLLVERHMEGLCPYAACGNDASTPYRSEEERAAESRRLKVRVHANGLFDASAGSKADHKGAYCSTRCKARSEWYRAILGRDGEGEMLEDVEERRMMVAASTQELLRQAAQEKVEAEQEARAAEAEAAASDPKTAAFASDLLSTLLIREKPTPSAPPAAPSLDSAKHDFERPAAPSVASSSSRFPSTPAPRAGSSTLSNPASALLPFTTASLTRTVLRSTSAIPVPPSRQPTRGANGLPPIRFLSEPRMLDEQGREVEWVGVDEEGESDEVRAMMEEGLRVKRMLERGELD
ncbi:hypothetical protein JCM10207_004735 [Rhodosporidiobolus poonsookiae]